MFIEITECDFCIIFTDFERVFIVLLRKFSLNSAITALDVLQRFLDYSILECTMLWLMSVAADYGVMNSCRWTHCEAWCSSLQFWSWYVKCPTYCDIESETVYSSGVCTVCLSFRLSLIKFIRWREYEVRRSTQRYSISWWIECPS